MSYNIQDMRLVAEVTTAAGAETARTGECRLRKVIVDTAAADGIFIVYDNTAASGTVMMQLTADTDANSLVVDFDPPLYFGTGVHVVPSGTGAKAYFYE